MLFGFISSHKNKEDSILIAETEKELSLLKDKKVDLDKSLKSLDENERTKTLEYNELRKRIEIEKD